MIDLNEFGGFRLKRAIEVRPSCLICAETRPFEFYPTGAASQKYFKKCFMVHQFYDNLHVKHYQHLKTYRIIATKNCQRDHRKMTTMPINGTVTSTYV